MKMTTSNNRTTAIQANFMALNDWGTHISPSSCCLCSTTLTTLSGVGENGPAFRISKFLWHWPVFDLYAPWNFNLSLSVVLAQYRIQNSVARQISCGVTRLDLPCVKQTKC